MASAEARFVISCPDISEKFLQTAKGLDSLADKGLLHPKHWLAKFYKERGVDYCRNYEEPK